jgi:hypothetical protein
MLLQNRVTPFGDIVAIRQRGTFTGNRGIIHDPMTKTLLTKRWASKAWLVCSCEYKGRRREVMGRRSWTELFFLDEAVALAAGHRPCFRCRREAAEAFRAAWVAKGRVLCRRHGHGSASRTHGARPQAHSRHSRAAFRASGRRGYCNVWLGLHGLGWSGVPLDRVRLRAAAEHPSRRRSAHAAINPHDPSSRLSAGPPPDTRNITTGSTSS